MIMTTTTKTAMLLLMMMMTTAIASSLLEDFETYANGTIEFYVPVEETVDGRRLSSLHPLSVNRRGAPEVKGFERMIAYVEPLGVQLHLDQAHDLFTPGYKEFAVEDDGSMTVLRDQPGLCM